MDALSAVTPASVEATDVDSATGILTGMTAGLVEAAGVAAVDAVLGVDTGDEAGVAVVDESGFVAGVLAGEGVLLAVCLSPLLATNTMPPTNNNVPNTPPPTQTPMSKPLFEGGCCGARTGGRHATKQTAVERRCAAAAAASSADNKSSELDAAGAPVRGVAVWRADADVCEGALLDGVAGTEIAPPHLPHFSAACLCLWLD